MKFEVSVVKRGMVLKIFCGGIFCEEVDGFEVFCEEVLWGFVGFDCAEEGLFVLDADEESGMSLDKVDAGRSSFSSVATSGNF